MTIGISQHKHISMDFEAAAKLGQQRGNFAAQMAAATQGASAQGENAQPVVLGMAFLDVGKSQ